MEFVLAVLLSAAAPFVASWRTSRQPVSSVPLEERVLGLCRRFPALVSASGLSPADFSSDALRADFSSLPPAPSSGRVPFSALSAAVFLLEESRERSGAPVYVGAATAVRSGPGAGWRAPRLSSARIFICILFGAAAGFAASAIESVPLSVAVMLFGLVAAVISLVDLDTLLVDVPLLALFTLVLVLLVSPPVSGLPYAAFASALLLPMLAAALLSSAGSAALLLRRSRERPRLLLTFFLMLAGLVMAMSAPYMLFLASLLSGSSFGPPQVALSAVPLFLLAVVARRMALSSAIIPSPSGPRLAAGPVSGVGDGDLMLLPAALLLPAAVLGVFPALSALLAAGPLLLLMLPFRRWLMPGVSAASAPVPFGPALLLAPLLVLCLSLSGVAGLPGGALL